MPANNNASNTPMLILNKYFSVINFGIVIVLLLIGVQFFLRPLYQDINSKKNLDFSDAETELETQLSYLHRLQSSIEIYKSINLDELSRIFEIVPTGKNENELYTSMSELFQGVGFELQNITVSDGPKEEIPNENLAIQSLNINVAVTGDPGYESFKSLLRRMEEHLRIIDVSSISYRPDTGNYVFNLTTYYQS